MIKRLRKIRGTVLSSAQAHDITTKTRVFYALLMSVRTLLIKLIILALILVLSCIPPPPNDGSMLWLEPHPTVRELVSLAFEERTARKRTACEEAIFGEYCYGIDKEDRDYVSLAELARKIAEKYWPHLGISHQRTVGVLMLPCYGSCRHAIIFIQPFNPDDGYRRWVYTTPVSAQQGRCGFEG